MTNISKRKLKSDVVQKISNQLLVVIAKADDKKSAHDLAQSLLTHTERIMLEYGYSFNDIGETLKVSSSTIAAAWQNKKRGMYAAIERQCRRYRSTKSRKRSNDNFLDFLEILLQAGMPPRGRGRWKSVFASLEKKN